MNINDFSYVILHNIFPYLEDRDLQALRVTSKKLSRVAKYHQFRRNDDFEKHVSSFLACSRHFNIETLKEADVILLPDPYQVPDPWQAHKKEYTLKVCLLLNLLSNRGPVIYLDQNINCKSLGGYYDQQTIMGYGYQQRCHMPYAHPNLLVVGTGEETLLKNLCNATEEAFDSQYQFLSEQCTSIEMQLDELFNSNQEFVEIMQLKEEERPPLSTEQQELCGKIENLLKIKTDVDDLIRATDTSISVEENHHYIDTFPGRLEVIVSTLKKLNEIKALFKHAQVRTKVVVCAHPMFLETPSCYKYEDSRFPSYVSEMYNLDSLYEELRNHKAIILLPRDRIARDERFASLN